MLSQIKTNKSPGLDGLRPEYYIHFGGDLKIPFINMINEPFVKGIIPKSVTLYHREIRYPIHPAEIYYFNQNATIYPSFLVEICIMYQHKINRD